MNFVNALEKIPGIIAQYEERTAKLKADVPQLESIVAKQWGKESELKDLKSELASLDRKITAALAPKKEEQDGEENKQVNTIEVTTTDPKKSMVAEPADIYQHQEHKASRNIAVGGYGFSTPDNFRARPKL